MKRTQILHSINTFNSYLLIAIAFLAPAFFLPFTANLFDLNKFLFLTLTTIILLVSWSIRNIVSQSFHLTISPVTIPVILFGLVMVITSLGQSTGQTIETLITNSGYLIVLTILFLIATSLNLRPKTGEHIVLALVASGVLLSILAVLETVSIGPGSWIGGINGSATETVFITPAGSVVALITFLIPVLAIGLILAVEKQHYLVKSALFGSAAIITAALVISAFTLLPGKPNSPVFLPFSTSWLIAVENIKSPKNFIIGVGANNYLSAFTRNRGVAFNQQEFWSTRFTTARNYPLHLFTTTGIIGLSIWLGLLCMLLRMLRRADQMSWVARSCFIGLGAIVITIFFIPHNTLLLITFSLFLIALIIDLKEHHSPMISELMLKLFAAKLVPSNHIHQQEAKQKAEVLPSIVGIPLILLSLFVVYLSYRVFAADVIFRQSLVAAAQNNGTLTYDKQRAAISMNPYIANYRRTYANTNLALANSLGSQENITDEQRRTVTTLLSQAIREGRNAVSINQDNPVNWESLAAIYRSLLGVDENAANFAITSYQQALNLDPFNPRLWVDIGGVFYQLENYPVAIEAFQRATQLKRDWANAHYNLANAYAQNQEYQRAITQYDAVLQLVDATSSDYAKALDEQNQLKEQVGETQTPQQPQAAELTTPDPIPSPIPGSESLELTNEDAPPSPRPNGSANFGDALQSQDAATQSGEATNSSEANNQ